MSWPENHEYDYTFTNALTGKKQTTTSQRLIKAKRGRKLMKMKKTKSKSSQNIEFVTINTWPGKSTQKPKKSQFGKNISFRETIFLLERELRAINAKNILIQSYFQSHEIKSTGWPLLTAQPKSAGIILSFKDQNDQPLSFPCDTYNSWQDNLKAIAKSLNSLRMVDRYGVSKNGQQYQGYTALPDLNNPMHNTILNAQNNFEKALQLVSKYSDIILDINSSETLILEAYNEAIKRMHPDKTEGNSEIFIQLTEAKKILF